MVALWPNCGQYTGRFFFTKIDGSVKLVLVATFYNPTLYKETHCTGTTTQTIATNIKTKPKQIFPKMKTKWSETGD
jgi:hypothetical protein